MNFSIRRRTLLLFCLAILTANARAQGPRIASLFPAGAKAGTSVEVEMKGGGLVGARRVLIAGSPGVVATLAGGGATVDESARPLFTSKCTTCHEPRSPANRSLSPEQWAQTVDRMINSRGAEINPADKTKIVTYLQALARAGQLSLKIAVAPDAVPGPREVRLLTDHGASTAFTFEVGSLPEVVCGTANSTPATAQAVTLPVVVNGVLTQSGQKQFFSFTAKKNQHLSFNLKAFRLNSQCAAYFNPVLYLYDAQGREVAKDLGRYGTDPVLDFVAPTDGPYTLLVRDLIWKGSPSSLYRLAMSELPADGVLLPTAAPPGAQLTAHLMPTGTGTGGGDEGSAATAAGEGSSFPVRVPEGANGVTMVATPTGEAPLLVRALPDGGPPSGGAGRAVSLPALFRGRIEKAGQTDTFLVHANHGGAGLEIYARRLGSPLRPRVTIKNAKKEIVAGRVADGEDDIRIASAFPAPGDYTVEITDADNGYGPAFAYCWESLDGTPDFQLTATPDAISLSPGMTTAVLIKLTKRENTPTITVGVEGLPPGITASTAFFPPALNEGVVTLTAAPTAPAGSGGAIRFVARAVTASSPDSGGLSIVRVARPVEIYRINNNPHSQPRDAAVVAVVTDTPNFTLSVIGTEGEASVALKPGGETSLKVHVERAPGYKGEVRLLTLGLPPGISAPNVVTVKGDQTTATIPLRANGGGDLKFLKDPTAPLRFVVAGYGGGGFGSFDGAPPAATNPITLMTP